MKKVWIMMICSVLVSGCMIGCGSEVADNTQICDFCDEEKVCQTRSIFGEKVTVCDDCMDELTGF